ncbi:MAG: TIM-barrel domain-containing protein [Caulobacteraceae bacterium]
MIGMRTAALAIVLAAPLPAAAIAAPAFQATPDGVVVTPVAGPARRVRLQVFGDALIHVTAVPGERFDLPASLMVVAKPDRSTAFSVSASADTVTLKTTAVTAEVSLATGAVRFLDASGRVTLAERDRGEMTPVTVEGKPYLAVRQVFNPNTTEGFYGLGQHQKGQMDYNGEDIELAQHNTDIAIPFVVSTRHYGVLWDNNSVTRFGDPKPYGLASRDVALYDASGKAGGLTAQYYADGVLKLQRVEADVNYQFAPEHAGLPTFLKTAKDATVVWTGALEAKSSGLQHFQLYSSGYIKVWVDGRLVLDRWRQAWNPWFRDIDLPMSPGKRHKLRIEWKPEQGYIAFLHGGDLPEAERHALSLSSEAGSAIDYYYVGGRDMDGVIAGYRRLTGKAPMAPQWAYGFWQSRQRYTSAADLIGTVQEYRRRQLPLDNIVQDWLYWRIDDWGSHRFDLARYPDPKGMIDQLHGLGAHFMISVWPKFYPSTDNGQALNARGFLYQKNLQVGSKDWVGYVNTFYDPYSQAARDLYWSQIHTRLDVLGVDAWWLDASEPDLESNLSIEERKTRFTPTALGPGAAFFNSYPLEHTRAVFDGWSASHPDVRGFSLTRSGFAGVQRNAAAVWSGDTGARWEDFKDQIAAGVNLSMSGVPNWTFDIGGFSVEQRYQNPSPADLDEWRELTLRWFQFGAFAPLFRSHGEAPFREIYTLAPEGSEVYASLAAYDRLRYRLLPYIYTLAADVYFKDAVIMRGLVMDFPDDPAARKINDEYLLGHSFLVAPVTTYKARTRSVYLPAGAAWYDFHTGMRLAGGQTVTAAAPLAQMPLFVRAGSIVPTGPAIQHTGEATAGPLTLLVYRGADGQFDLYEDDGTSNAYQRGQSARIPIRYDDHTGAVTLGARLGAYPGMATQRTVRIKWISGPRRDAADLDAAPDREALYTGQTLVLRP